LFRFVSTLGNCCADDRTCVLLGRGKQVFADGTVPAALRLIESVTYPNGVLQLAYDAAGTPTHGQMG
jgi:hypothetical protein